MYLFTLSEENNEANNRGNVKTVKCYFGMNSKISRQNLFSNNLNFFPWCTNNKSQNMTLKMRYLKLNNISFFCPNKENKCKICMF